MKTQVSRADIKYFDGEEVGDRQDFTGEQMPKDGRRYFPFKIYFLLGRSC